MTSRDRWRPATREDAQAIRALVRSAYAKWVPLIGREPLPMQADYERAVGEHAFDLVERDGVLAGLVETVGTPDGLYIVNVAVAPDFQGQGLGRRLLALAEGKAREAGFARVALRTNAAFAANIRLYLAAGYGVDKREPFLDGEVVQMSKSVTGQINPSYFTDENAVGTRI